MWVKNVTQWAQYINLQWELECKKWSQFRVNSETDAYNSSMQNRFLDKKCTEISHFDFDLKTNIVILWTETWLVIQKNLNLAEENGIKTVYDFHTIGRQWPPFWFHFSHTPNDWSYYSRYIYRAHWSDLR
jgi:hypothetical protein